MRTSIVSPLSFALSFALLLAACGANEPDTSLNEPNTTQQDGTPPVSYGAMEGQDGMNVNGIAVIHHTSDSTGTVTLQVNIEPAASGYHYQAWVENSRTSVVQDVGTLESATNDVRHEVRYESKTSLRGFESAFITLQTEGSSTRGKVVARGNLQASGE